MKKVILFILSLVFSFSLQAQKDSSAVASLRLKQGMLSKSPDVTVNIYPVPVREDYFNIKTDREVSFVKITNIIGQDIYRAQYNNPQTLNKIILDNPGRGMYLVTIIFSDGVRVVKKIMIEDLE